jgi:benzoyl-CoA reductase/2-hydroxyglutaryl-CoA dehydratase subunit BcrC/BadD/HgdB
VSGKPTGTSGGLKVKPTTPGEPGVKPETQTPASAGVKLEKVSELKEVVEKPNTRYTYGIIRARRNVVISLVNKNGFIKINIVTMTSNRPISGFDARLLKRVIIALNDLYNELTTLKPDLEKQQEKTKSNVRVY